MAESFAPGAVVSAEAQRHEISPQHLFQGRMAARLRPGAPPAGLLFHLLDAWRGPCRKDGAAVSDRRYMRIVLRDRPVRRAISRIER